MEKLTRSFATEADCGKDATRLIVGRLDDPAPNIVDREIGNRGASETPDRTFSSMASGVSVDDEIHARGNGTREGARIAIKAKGRVLFVDPIDVVVVVAQGNYVALVHKSGTHLVRETMSTAERKLAPLGFVRIHRCILVNTTLVKDLSRNKNGTYVLRTTDGSEHPVGRTYKENLKVIARSWLGIELV